MEGRNDQGKPASDVLQMLASEEDPALGEVAHSAIADGELLKGLLSGLVSRQDTYRYNCFKVLLRISEGDPAILYPEWDYFVGLLRSENSYHRSTSVLIIANLTGADTERRFEDIFDEYFSLLDDESIIPARYLAGHAGRIVQAKPHLRTRITERLLAIDDTHHAQGRKDLVKGDIIEAFGEFFAQSDDKEKMLAFVESQLECSSPKTRKRAKGFLKQYGG